VSREATFRLARARDFHTHHYSRLDPEQLRETIDTALPELINAVEALNIPEIAEDEAAPY
jgi:uncharacterized protein with HEPN domain